VNFQILKLVCPVDRGDWQHCLVTNLYYCREVDGRLAYHTSLRSLQAVKTFTSNIVNRMQELAQAVKLVREWSA